MDVANRTWVVVRDSVKQWMADNAFIWAAALAFYAILSLAPLIVLIIFVLGLIWGEQAASGQIASQAEEMIGSEGASVVQTVIAQADRPGVGSVSAIIGLIGLLLAATGFFVQFQAALNQVWNVKPDPDQGWWNMIRVRLISFLMLGAIALVLLASMVISTVLTGMANIAEGMLPVNVPWLPHVVEIAVSLIVATLLFAVVYRYLPDVEIAWSETWFGAFITAVLFVIGKWGISLYLGYAGVGSAYGAAGSLAILLVWLYYTFLIVLLGAEVTQVYARERGATIRPSAHAKPAHPEPPIEPPPHGRPATGH